MKSESQMAMECTITRDILDEMYSKLGEGDKEVIPTDEPEDIPMEELTIEEMRAELESLREYKLTRVKANNLMYHCNLSTKEQVDAVVNASKAFFDIISSRGGKKEILVGISELINRYRKK